MKNHIIFIIGLIILLATVWVATMAGIHANKRAFQKEEQAIYYII